MRVVRLRLPSRLIGGESLGVVTLGRWQTILHRLCEERMNRSQLITGAAWVIGAWLAPMSGMAAESAVSAEKVVKEAQETIEGTRQYTAQQKETFQRKAQEELAVMQQQILELRAKVEKASDATRADLQQSLNELEKKKDGVREKLDELKHTTDAKWHEVRERMNSALDEVKRSYRRLLAHLP